MPVVSDFTIIHGVNTGITMGDRGFHPIFETTFNTGGRHGVGHAFITFMIRGLTVATHAPLIRINNVDVGRILPYTGANSQHWFTQTINITGAMLNNGNNEFEVHAAPSERALGTYDDYVLKNIMCFFQQDV